MNTPLPEPTDDVPAPAPELAADPAPSMSPAQCAAELAARFPALFTPGQCKPIKLKIQADIQARAPGIFTKKILSAFLHRHTTSTAYLRAMATATHRFDLDGAEAGELAEEHRTAAAAEAERRRAIVKERRQAEAKAAREAARGAAREAAREADAAKAPRRPRPDRPRAPQARQDRPARGERPPRERAEPAAPSMPPVPADPARAARQALLRAWESTPLSAANFLALKRMTQAELDAQLDQARAERGTPPNKSSR